MNIRTVVLSAAMAVGVGQAEAASYDVIFTLTRAEHVYTPTFEDPQIVTPLDEWWDIPANNPVSGLLQFHQDASGRTVAMLYAGPSIIFEYPWRSEMSSDGEYFGQATFGGVWYTDLWWSSADGKGRVAHSDDHRPNYYFAEATFELAPVPLPPTAALIPLGIGALAALRRRRRLS